MPTSRRREVCSYLAAHVLTPRRLRFRLLRAADVSIERHLELLSGFRVTGEGRLTVGDGCFVNHDCLIDAAADVVLGRNVALGNRVSLLTSGHEYGDERARAGARVLRPIVIGDGAWLGAGVTVLGGVTVGAGAVVAAGSLVRADVPPNTLWAGSPARFVRDLPVGSGLDRGGLPAQSADVVADLA
ncbi:MAG: acetyltransferase [Blastococcus sp.]|nr:acetyltransferase [Blastococcus sp.]